MNRDRYREHAVPPRSDVRSPLGRWVGEPRMSEGEMLATIREALTGGVFVFTRRMYEQMAPYEQAVLDGLARRFIEGRR